MVDDVARILITRRQISRRISALAGEISGDYDTLTSIGQRDDIVLIGVLSGSIVFVADLMRELRQKICIRFVTVSSYPGDATTSQGAAILGEVPDDLAGRHVLIVDDILDSGRTIQLLREQVLQRRPASLRVCVLLRKEVDSAMSTPCDYIGFDIPDEFVVGYGLDYDGYYRNLPCIAVLKPEAMLAARSPDGDRAR